MIGTIIISERGDQQICLRQRTTIMCERGEQQLCLRQRTTIMSERELSDMIVVLLSQT
jgi:hypothetical protein